MVLPVHHSSLLLPPPCPHMALAPALNSCAGKSAGKKGFVSYQAEVGFSSRAHSSLCWHWARAVVGEPGDTVLTASARPPPAWEMGWVRAELRDKAGDGPFRSSLANIHGRHLPLVMVLCNHCYGVYNQIFHLRVLFSFWNGNGSSHLRCSS